MVSESHNVLSVNNLKNLYHSEYLARTYPITFRSRLIFKEAHVTTMRPRELDKTFNVHRW